MKAARVIGVIPARYGSTRFEGKPLKKILEKPLLQWVIEGAKTARCLSDLIVATDDERIAALATANDVRAVMTDPHLPSGSDRVWAAVQDLSCDYVINIQGDEPLLTGEVLDTLATAFKDEVRLATLARPIKTIDELNNPAFAKIALNKNGDALYFSRAPIPYPKDGKLQGHPSGAKTVSTGTVLTAEPPVGLKHIGLYGFKREFLKEFCAQEPVDIEKIESLEQLRALWMGVPIKVVLTDYDSWGVDTPEDVVRVEKLLREKRSQK